MNAKLIYSNAYLCWVLIDENDVPVIAHDEMLYVKQWAADNSYTLIWEDPE